MVIALNILTNFVYFVRGIPVPQGSKSVSRSGHLYDANAKTLKPWRKLIAEKIRSEDPDVVIDAPVKLTVGFCFPRPKSHFNKSGLKSSAPTYVQTTPDLDKLIRAVGDGVATDAGLLKDDSRIVSINAEKHYCDEGSVPGVLILIEVL